ncbi:MAG: hypothetical protein IKN11_09550 [Bacteroidales bacterium]|nr:hypothetical protein [Bacteroidales bacterium]
MKNSKLMAVLVVAASMIVFASCKKEKIVPLKVHLTSTHLEIGDGSSKVVTDQINTWENNMLTKLVTSMKISGSSTSTEKIFVYKDDVCTESYTTDNIFHRYFNYKDGRLTGFVNLYRGDTIIISDITAYTSDGFIKEYQDFLVDAKEVRKYHLNWRDGDLMRLIVEYVTKGKPNDTINYSYDKHPSAYTGFPLAYCLEDPSTFGTFYSKHNLIRKGETATYENGRIVSLIREREKLYFTYDDGTGKRE